MSKTLLIAFAIIAVASAVEKQIKLDDIERDNLNSAKQLEQPQKQQVYQQQFVGYQLPGGQQLSVSPEHQQAFLQQYQQMLVANGQGQPLTTYGASSLAGLQYQGQSQAQQQYTAVPMQYYTTSAAAAPNQQYQLAAAAYPQQYLQYIQAAQLGYNAQSQQPSTQQIQQVASIPQQYASANNVAYQQPGDQSQYMMLPADLTPKQLQDYLDREASQSLTPEQYKSFISQRQQLSPEKPQQYEETKQQGYETITQAAKQQYEAAAAPQQQYKYVTVPAKQYEAAPQYKYVTAAAPTKYEALPTPQQYKYVQAPVVKQYATAPAKYEALPTPQEYKYVQAPAKQYTAAPAKYETLPTPQQYKYVQAPLKQYATAPAKYETLPTPQQYKYVQAATKQYPTAPSTKYETISPQYKYVSAPSKQFESVQAGPKPHYVTLTQKQYLQYQQQSPQYSYQPQQQYVAQQQQLQQQQQKQVYTSGVKSTAAPQLKMQSGFSPSSSRITATLAHPNHGHSYSSYRQGPNAF